MACASCVGSFLHPKKVENLAHAVSLHFMHYNFRRIHESLTIEDERRCSTSEHRLRENHRETQSPAKAGQRRVWAVSQRSAKYQFNGQIGQYGAIVDTCG